MARKNIGAKPYIMPMPVLMLSAYDENEKPCAMLAVWGGISNEKEVTITIASERHTLKGILARQAFVVSMGDVEHATACDYLGITKGGKVPDKFEKSGFHATKSEFVDAPLIEELPLALECKVKSFENGILIGEIVNVSADESVVTDGKVDIKKVKPISFDPFGNAYFGVGEKVGNAFRDGMTLK